MTEPLTETPPKVKFEALRVGERFAHELMSLTYSQPPAFIKTNAYQAVIAHHPEVVCSLSIDDQQNMEIYAIDR